MGKSYFRNLEKFRWPVEQKPKTFRWNTSRHPESIQNIEPQHAPSLCQKIIMLIYPGPGAEISSTSKSLVVASFVCNLLVQPVESWILQMFVWVNSVNSTKYSNPDRPNKPVGSRSPQSLSPHENVRQRLSNVRLIDPPVKLSNLGEIHHITSPEFNNPWS